MSSILTEQSLYRTQDTSQWLAVDTHPRPCCINIDRVTCRCGTEYAAARGLNVPSNLFVADSDTSAWRGR